MKLHKGLKVQFTSRGLWLHEDEKNERGELVRGHSIYLTHSEFWDIGKDLNKFYKANKKESGLVEK